MYGYTVDDEDWWYGDKHLGRLLLVADSNGFAWQRLADFMNEDGLKASQLLRKQVNYNVADQYVMKRVEHIVADTPGRYEAVLMFARGVIFPDGVLNPTRTPSLTVTKDDDPGEVLERFKDILRRLDKWGPIHAYLRGGRFWR